MSLSFKKTIPFNESNERPTHVIFYDVESRVDYQNKDKQSFTPFLWTMIYRRYANNGKSDQTIPLAGQDILTFWDNVVSHCYKKTKVYLVSHHLEVDFMPLKGFIELPNRGFKLDKLISHGRVLSMYWSNGSSKLVVMNNGNLFDGSIEQWGSMLGVSKLEMPDDNAPLNQWIEYCMRDTEIVSLMWEYLLKFMDEHDLGNFKVTKASLAMNSFRHRFMFQKIALHNHPGAIILERESYKGGRFEAIQIGNFKDGKFHTLDINSMYGYIELVSDLPYELRGYKETESVDNLMARCKRYCVIAEVNITTNERVFPHKINDKIVYDEGTFTTVLTTPEIEYIYAHGTINWVKRITWYYKAKILSQFADYFLKLKTQYDIDGNKPMRQVTKLYLNALYGKFGQHGFEDSIIGECDPDIFEVITGYNLDTHERYDIMKYGGKIHQSLETLSGDFTFTAIASHITAIGRLMLWHLIKIAGYYHVYHVATDSLVVDEVGFNRLQAYIDPTEPGKLKLEKTFTSYTVFDVNDTLQDGKLKTKGIPKKANQLNEDTFEVTCWPRVTSLIKQGIYDAYYTRVIKKHLNRTKYHALMQDGIQPEDTNEYAESR